MFESSTMHPAIASLTLPQVEAIAGVLGVSPYLLTLSLMGGER